MSDPRDILKASGKKAAGPVAKKRTEKKRSDVPDKPKTKVQRESEWEQYGKPTTWKLHPDVGPAVTQAAWKHGVSRRDLAEFLLRAGDTSRIALPMNGEFAATWRHLSRREAISWALG